MNISHDVLEAEYESPLLAKIQKIAICTVIPMLLLSALESVVKNLILINLANFTIALANGTYAIYAWAR